MGGYTMHGFQAFLALNDTPFSGVTNGREANHVAAMELYKCGGGVMHFLWSFLRRIYPVLLALGVVEMANVVADVELRSTGWV